MNEFAPEGNESLSADMLTVIALWDELLVREKKALGQELHEDVAQVLTALRLEIALFIRQQHDHMDLVDKAKRMLAMADQSLQTVGNLLNHLQTPNQYQGLQAILEQLCWDFNQRHALNCKLTFHNDCNGFDEKQSHAVFSIVQEALSNIVRHAAAENADIICSQTAGSIKITVLDDGCGFGLAEAFNGPGLGLQAMRWRAMAIGGSIAINSNQPSGVQVTLVMPCRS